MTDIETVSSRTRMARIAGAMLLGSMATAIFSQVVVRGSLVVPGDAAQTASRILAGETLYRVGIVADLATFVGVAVLVWALYQLLRPVDRRLAALAALLRTLELAIHFVATLFGLLALQLLGGAPYLEAIGTEQRQALARFLLAAQGAGLNLGFLLLGLGSALFALLLLRSREVPRSLAAWGIFASLLLAAEVVGQILYPPIGRYFMAFSAPMFFYEVPLGAWLLIRGAAAASSAAPPGGKP